VGSFLTAHQHKIGNPGRGRNPKAGGVLEPGSGKNLRPILIPDLGGDRSH